MPTTGCCQDQPASTSSTPPCATARRRRASTSRSRTRSPSPRMLDEFGIDYVEGGYPGANPTDTAFFAQKRTAAREVHRLRHDQARRRLAPPTIPASRRCSTPKSDAICFVAKTWDYHVRVALGCTRRGEPRRHPRLGRGRGRRRPGGDGRLRALLRRLQGQPGLCAGLRPHRLRGRRALGRAVRHQWRHACRRRSSESSREVADGIPGDHLGIHAHDDTDQAVANSLAAVRGRRAPDPGHAQRHRRALRQRQPHLAHPDADAEAGLRRPLRDRHHAEAARRLIARCRARFDEMLNRAPNRQAPYVGASAFATKAGIHASAIAEGPATYEHVPPDSVGNRRHVLVSDQGGKANFVAELERRGIDVSRERPAARRAAREVKEREAEGYAYEGADASLRAAGAPHARHRARLLPRRELPRHGRAPPQRASASSSPSRRRW